MSNLHFIFIDERGINPNFMDSVHEKIVILATHYWRITRNSWVVSSQFSAQEWINKLQLHPPSDITYASLNEGYTGNRLVIKLDASDRFGFMDQGFWEWFDKVGTKTVLHMKIEPSVKKEVQ